MAFAFKLGQILSEFQNRGFNGPTKRTNADQKVNYLLYDPGSNIFETYVTKCVTPKIEMEHELCENVHEQFFNPQ